ncbi:hypothetical protein [Tunicatimonas pelagia]|uniref:hypothetical protein n=1 Tax=Tunicatimonas pelagia TaxID=931531 RepID=UPI0026658A97|nr:hypothetical protein [Tunicatimonas pelagia]WKN40496.1 hypothetical protein P0M28_15745 [Tunicatimonas pelagia]
MPNALFFCHSVVGYWLFFALLSATLSGCGRAFVPDPIDPRLPVYSEEGKRSAGCFINDDVWRSDGGGGTFSSNDDGLWITFQSEDSTIHLTISGELPSNTDSRGESINVGFTLDNRQLSDDPAESISEIPQKAFVLDGQDNYGYLIRNFDDTVATFGAGQLILRRILLDQETTFNASYIVAGTFSFTATSDSLGLVDVSNGRFDYSVRESRK